jgi:hypothetical protein
MASTMIYTNVSSEYLKEASEKVNYGPMPLPKLFFDSCAAWKPGKAPFYRG